MNKLTHFPYKHVLILGLAKSGTAAAHVLLKNGFKVRVNDHSTIEDSEIVKDLKRKGAEVVVGSHPLSVLENIDIIVKNPGIRYDNVIIKEAEKRDIPIITEVELAANLASRNELIGITGSNGKTTTTTLIAEMLKESGETVKLAGNIGVASIEVAENLKKNEKLVLELSSFQLMGVRDFKLNTAVLLNLYEAHLDYHGSMENYVATKVNIFNNQTETDYLIYNADDSLVKNAVKEVRSIRIPFSVNDIQLDGAYVKDDIIYFKNEQIMDLKDIVLVGEHNLENILAAISAALVNGATKEGIQRVLQTFSGVKHRLQFVKKVNGRLFYNDSKATNILATQKALSSFKQPTILLAGGLDRGNSFDSLLPHLNYIKAMVVFGETKEKLQEMGQKASISTILSASDVEEATKKAYELSNEGDIILLSPACASWDQYKTFEERGDMFIRAVHILA